MAGARPRNGSIVSIMKTGSHQFALVEADQRCIDHVFHRHDDRRGQFLPRQAAISHMSVAVAPAGPLERGSLVKQVRAAAND